MWTLYLSFWCSFIPAKLRNQRAVGQMSLIQRRAAATFLTGLSLWLRCGKLIQATAFVSVRSPLECVNCRGVHEACIYRNTWLHTQEISQEQLAIFRPGLSGFCLFLFISCYFVLSFGPRLSAFASRGHLIFFLLELVLLWKGDSAVENTKGGERQQGTVTSLQQVPWLINARAHTLCCNRAQFLSRSICALMCINVCHKCCITWPPDQFFLSFSVKYFHSVNSSTYLLFWRLQLHFGLGWFSQHASCSLETVGLQSDLGN